MTAGWRECADPVVLAAAVAAGVEVQCVAVDGRTWETGCEDSESFRRCMANDCRYRVPSSWSWSPEPPADVPTGAERYLAERLADPEYRAAYEAAAPAAGDDLRERIARAIWEDDERVKRDQLNDWRAEPLTDHEVYLRNADAVLAVLPAPPIDEGAGPSGPPWYLAQDVWMALGGDSNAFSAWAHCEDDRRTWGDAWAQIIAAVGGSRMEGDTNPPPGTILDLPSYQWVRESPTPSPVPPWPGAVLSGLCDEDGVPTWLAQAGQVRGEQVRRRSDFMWVNNDQMVAHLDTVWVEVRAPRAVPVPETERVPWWAAVGREVTDQDGERVPIEHVQCGDGAGPSVTAYNAAERRDTRLLRVPIPVRGDGTVEVLKDGER